MNTANTTDNETNRQTDVSICPFVSLMQLDT